jgi:hypothetical protein
MFRCAHEPEGDSMQFPDGVQFGLPWAPSTECRFCGQRYELPREQMFEEDGQLTEWYFLELIAYGDWCFRRDVNVVGEA